MILDGAYDDISNGEKTIDEKHMIHMWCENKGVIVSAPLVQDITTSINNQWSDFFQGGLFGSALGILDQISTATVAWSGASLYQPYMSRKMWKGSSPLSFQLDFNFVATTDAKTDVVDKINAIAVMATPHKGTKSDIKKLLEDTLAQNKSDKEEDPLSVSKVKDVTTDVTQFVVDMYDLVAQKWVSPGPAVIPSDDSKSRQDAPITVLLPMYGTLKNCYIENVSITTSKSLDINGYPLGAKVSVKISRMDSLVCQNKNDKFTMDWEYDYEDNAVRKISTLLNKVSKIGRDFYIGTWEKLATLLNGGDISSVSNLKKIMDKLYVSDETVEETNQ